MPKGDASRGRAAYLTYVDEKIAQTADLADVYQADVARFPAKSKHHASSLLAQKLI
jgi:hypothetical protein